MNLWSTKKLEIFSEYDIEIFKNWNNEIMVMEDPYKENIIPFIVNEQSIKDSSEDIVEKTPISFYYQCDSGNSYRSQIFLLCNSRKKIDLFHVVEHFFK